MSSNDKRDLTTKANDGAVSDGKGKAGSATVYGDIVTLPPDADDVIFTTICDSSISGVVDAEVEMSYDKENWCPAVTEEFTAGTSVTGWGNQKYIDLVPTGGEYKNKHAKGTLAFDASGNEVGTATGTRDVLYNFMQKNKPFNINWWHKSETVPNIVVTSPEIKAVTHAYNKDSSLHELRSPSNPWGSGNLGANQTWSYSFWLRTNGTNTQDYATVFIAKDSSGTNQVNYFYLYRQGAAGELRLRIGNSTNTIYPTSASSHVNIFDDNWHHVVITCDGTGSTTSHTAGLVGSNHKLYIDGVFQVASSETTGTTDYGSVIDKMAITRGVGSSNEFEGYFAEVSFWTSDLSSDADSSTGASSKISSLYNSGVPTTLTGETGLYAWYRMGATTNDSGTASPWIQDFTGNSGALEPWNSIYDSSPGDSGAIHTLATSESIYRAAVPAVTANNYNPIIFRQGNKDPFSNEKYLNLSKGTGEDKNKYLSAPDTYSSTPNFDVTKYVYTKTRDSYNTAGKDRAIYVQNPWTYSDWASSTNWSISMWLKYDGDDPSGSIGVIKHGGRGIILSKNSNSLIVTHNLSGPDPTVTIPATLNDGNWHNVTITNSNSTTYQTIGTDPSTCNTLVYLNGALVTPSSGGTATSTVTYGNNSSNPVYLNLGPGLSETVDASSTFLHVSTWTKTLSSTEVNSILGANDKPKDLAGQSNLACWLPLGDGYDTSNPSTVDTVVGSSAKFWDMSGNGRHALPHQANTAGGNVAPSNSDVGWDQTDSPVEGVTNLGTSENVYIAPSTTDRDVFHEKMGATSPFSINTWFNSSNAPATTSNTTTFTNYKFIQGYSHHGTNTGILYRPDSPGSLTGRNATAHDFMATSGGGFSASGWFRSPNPYAGTSNANKQQITGSMFYWGGDNWADRLYLYVDAINNRIALACEEGNARTFNFKYGDTSTWDKDETWRHIVLTYDGTFTTNSTSISASFKVYVDGVEQTLDTTNSTNHSLPYSDASYAGPTDGVMDSDTNSYAIYISSRMDKDSITFWNKTLNQDDIDAIYGSGKITDITQHNVSGGANYTNDCWCHYTCGDDPNDAQGDGSNDTYVLGTNSLVDVKNGNNLRFKDAYSVIQRISTYATNDPQYQAPVTTYTDSYLPVLFNNGAKATITNFKNTKCFNNSGAGNADYFTISNLLSGSNQVLGKEHDWTISFWFKGTDSNGAIFGGSNDHSSFHCLIYSLAGHDNLQLQFNQGSVHYTGTDIHDDAWHNVVVSFKAAPSGTNWYWLRDDSSNQSGLAVYVDGTRATAATQTAGSSNTSSELFSGSDFRFFSRGTWSDSAQGDYDEIAIFDTCKSDDDVTNMYNSGVPTDLSSDSSCKVYLRADNMDTDNITNGMTITNSSTASDASNYVTTATTDNAGDLEVKDLGTSESIYIAASTTEKFGNGLTASFTKKLGSGTTWNSAGTETTKLLLSFDGFEDGADAFNAYDASSLLDGNWHNLQLTWDGSSTNTEDVKVFADGVELSISDSGNNKLNKTAADKHFKYTTGTFIPGTFGASGWKEAASTDSIYAFQGSLDNLSLHSEVTTLAKAQEFYGKGGNLEGKPHNYQMSNTLTYSNVEGWWTFDEAGDSITVANDRTSNNIDLTLNNFVSGGNGLVTMSNSDSIYLVNPIKGEGFTVSITKNLKDDGTWVESQDQTARLILSFNGFESAAEYWVAYNVNQTGLSPAVNLLDGLWHSVTISYAGTTDNSGNALGTDEIRFGPTQVSGVDQPFHFQVAFDGQVLESINSGKGYNLAKGGASGVDANAGFVIENKHLRHENSVATYIPTTYLASGIAETAGAHSIYAFQGGFDESSFHSDSWWASSTDYNQEKPLTIYGISSALSNPIRRAPYNLRSPATIEVDAATLPNQYIDPNPTSATNTNGGLEVYYRWGDTTGDCSQSIRDVKSHETSPASLNRDIVAHNIVHEDAVALDTDASESTTYAKDLTYNTSGTNKMYVAQSTETTLGGLSTNAVKISGCGANTCQQQGILSAKLPHMRVKWSGSGSCDLGEDKCRAQLWFRRRKK